jgi:hypothetical protein
MQLSMSQSLDLHATPSGTTRRLGSSPRARTTCPHRVLTAPRGHPVAVAQITSPITITITVLFQRMPQKNQHIPKSFWGSGGLKCSVLLLVILLLLRVRKPSRCLQTSFWLSIQRSPYRHWHTSYEGNMMSDSAKDKTRLEPYQRITSLR